MTTIKINLATTWHGPPAACAEFLLALGLAPGKPRTMIYLPFGLESSRSAPANPAVFVALGLCLDGKEHCVWCMWEDIKADDLVLNDVGDIVWNPRISWARLNQLFFINTQRDRKYGQAEKEVGSPDPARHDRMHRRRDRHPNGGRRFDLRRRFRL